MSQTKYEALRYCSCPNLRNECCKCAYQIGSETIKRSFAWRWSPTEKTHSVRVSKDRRLIFLHGNFSNGNAVIRGDTAMVNDNHYYWEISIMRAVYGASTMIGVATSKVAVDKNSHDFSHFLGNDDQSWGLTSEGALRHDQKNYPYHERSAFNEGTLVGVYLNMWEGTLEYFINRRPLGVAFRGLRDQILFPVVSTTSARGLMQLSYASATPHSLNFLALKQIRLNDVQSLPFQLRLKLPDCWWLLPQRETPQTNRTASTRLGIRLIISSDSDDDELSRHLRARMRKVVENTVPVSSRPRKKRKLTKQGSIVYNP